VGLLAASQLWVSEDGGGIYLLRSGVERAASQRASALRWTKALLLELSLGGVPWAGTVKAGPETWTAFLPTTFRSMASISPYGKHSMVREQAFTVFQPTLC